MEVRKKVIKGRGVAVTVPDTYVSGDQEISGDPERLLYAYDTKLGSAGTLTTLFISKEPLPGGEETKLESRIASVVESLKDGGATDIETKHCVYGNNECVAIACTKTIKGETLRWLDYFIKKGADLYVLIFTTPISEFSRRYDEFSQIFNSFRILEE